jgi:hypothetical protein
MITRCLLVAFILSMPAIVGADDVRTRAECEKIKLKIRNVEAKMRAGYTRARGEKLEAELRRLRALRHKACRR